MFSSKVKSWNFWYNLLYTYYPIPMECDQRSYNYDYIKLCMFIIRIFTTDDTICHFDVVYVWNSWVDILYKILTSILSNKLYVCK